MKENVLDVVHDIEERFTNPSRRNGLMTGFEKLDHLTVGLHPGELFVLAARPSMGKTALALNLVRNIALKQNVPTALFSLEQSRSLLSERLLSMVAGVPPMKLRTGMISAKRDLPRLAKAASQVAEMPLWIDDTMSLDILKLSERIRRLKGEHGIRFAVIDYLQLIRGRSASSRESRQEEVAEIAWGLKALARELSIPLLVTSQLNRQPESRPGGRPRLGDLRESGAIEECADLVGLLMRAEYYAEDEEEREEYADQATLILAKNHHGPSGDVPLKFHKELLQFESRADDENY